MKEISLNVLDIVQNSLAAGASKIEVLTSEDSAAGTLLVKITDNGRGMTPEQAAAVSDPFYTTRTTRRVGLGIPLFRMACEMTGGEFSIDSAPGRGTVVSALFRTGHIDCMPLGDMNETMLAIITGAGDTDIVYRRIRDGEEIALDTAQFREVLGEIPLSAPEVAAFIKGYLDENFG